MATFPEDLNKESYENTNIVFDIDRCIKDMKAASEGDVSEFTPVAPSGYILCKSIVEHLRELKSLKERPENDIGSVINAVKIIKDYCESNAYCDDGCIFYNESMDLNRERCRITDTIPDRWEFLKDIEDVKE